MDMRLRIIITVFIVVVIFYFVQMILSYMKKKEHFTSHYFDDVESYVDAPVAKTSVPVVTQEKAAAPAENTKPYELRIFILDEIEKLNISDKTVKGNVMEALFSETSINELSGLSKEDRIKKVKEVYEKSSGGSATPTVDVKKSFDEKLKSYFTDGAEGSVDIHLPEVKDYFENDFKNKTEKAISKLDLAITALTDMKDILRGNATKEQYIPDLPVPPLPPQPKKTNELIEGFENVRGFAYY